jgi:2-dehydropantoate 2-reductase
MHRVDVAILGAGALGSILGAHLIRAGHSVALLARGRRLEQLRAQGLHVKGLVDFRVPALALGDPAGLQAADVLIVATKAIDTLNAIAPLKHVEIGTTFSIQNGVMKNELLGQGFGTSRVLGALANFSGELQPSGETLFTRNVNLLIGELMGGASPRAEKISHLIDAAGVRCTAVDNILEQEWSKFAAWVPLAALSAATRAVTGDFLREPGSALVVVRLIHEIRILAQACDVGLTDEAFFPVATLTRIPEAEAVEAVRKLGEGFRQNVPQHRMSTLQDLENHRRMEIDETLGFAARKAMDLKLELPLLAAFYGLLSTLDHLNA